MDVLERKRILATNVLREVLLYDVQRVYPVFKGSMITVTNTYLLDGGKLMKVYLSFYSYNGSDLDDCKALSFLNKIKGKIRYKLGLMLSNKLKFIPSIDFYIDDSRDVYNGMVLDVNC